MLLLGLDLECSSLDPKTGKILEVGYCLKKVNEDRPWLLKSEFVYSKSWGDDFIPHEATLVNGIFPDHCKRFGRPLATIAKEINDLIKKHKVDYIVCHNAAFDIPYYLHHVEDLSVDHWEDFKATPVICTMTHVPYEPSITTRSLSFLAASKGFLNPFPHSALSDVLTMFKVLDCYDINKVVEISKEPSAVYQAMVGFNDREKAKKLSFRWCELEGKTYEKAWVKRLRNSELEDHTARLGAPIRKIAD
jgi:DNA polymerase-3 subunit epsilon